MLLDRRLRLALRALLIALWAVATVFAPAHAAIDALEDPCQHAAAVDVADGHADKDFHATHDCGTCHVHVLAAPAVQALKSQPRSENRVVVDASAGPSAKADGPYRPPQA